MSIARAQPDRPITHPFTRPVTTVRPLTSARHGGHLRPPWEATVRGIPPDILALASVTRWRAP